MIPGKRVLHKTQHKDVTRSKKDTSAHRVVFVSGTRGWGSKAEATTLMAGYLTTCGRIYKVQRGGDSHRSQFHRTTPYIYTPTWLGVIATTICIDHPSCKCGGKAAQKKNIRTSLSDTHKYPQSHQIITTKLAFLVGSEHIYIIRLNLLRKTKARGLSQFCAAWPSFSSVYAPGAKK